MVKQAIIFRRDLQMSSGKMASQAAHAAFLAAEAAPYETVSAWRRNGLTTVVLEAPDESALHTLHELAVRQRLPAALYRDEGLTETPPGAVTALGIGPGYIDVVTRDLPLWTDDGTMPAIRDGSVHNFYQTTESFCQEETL